MSTEFKLPELGENIHEGTVVRILVKAGDIVTRDQSVLEIETGKASVEVPTTIAGRIAEILVREGAKAKVGQSVLVIDESAAPIVAKPAAKPAPQAVPQAAAPAATPAPAPAPAAKAEPPPVAPQPAAPRAAPQPAAPISQTSTAHVPAAPSVRQFAREIGVNLGEVAGSGPGGRVSQDDVKAHARAVNTSGGGQPARAVAPPLPDFARFGATEREQMTNIRVATAEHMAMCWNTIPHVTIHEDADITELEKLRQQYRTKAEAAGAKLTLTAFLVKIAASALKNFPKFNASLDTQAQQIVYKRFCHIGIAVDTDRGLVVPVIRDADRKNVIQIALELNRVAERAKARKMSPDDMQGGTFTITNIGSLGGRYFTPIVNWPEVAILGLGRGSLQPVNIGGFFQPRQILPLSLSFDHRIIDGADGARFVRWVVDAIQQPAMLAVEG